MKQGRRQAIIARCRECHVTGDWGYPKSCKEKTCPLYPARPSSKVKGRKNLKSMIRIYCLWCCTGAKEEVRLCPVTDCALYKWRPYQTEAEKKWKKAQYRARFTDEEWKAKLEHIKKIQAKLQRSREKIQP